MTSETREAAFVPGPVAELLRRNELALAGNGCVVLAGLPLALLRWFDAQFSRLAASSGAEEYRFPSLIARETLARAGYFEAFPDGATGVHAPGHDGSHLLSPAVCYHCYALLADQTLEEPCVLTCVGTCHRHEGGAYEPLARLWEFTMREVVFLGPAAWVARQREEWIERVRDLARSLGLAGELELATDPFFGGPARGKTLLQQLKALKYELRLRAGAEGQTLAVASFNLHEAFFGRRFGIALPGGAPAHSACVAFGLERWVFAVLAQRGFDAARELCSGGDE